MSGYTIKRNSNDTYDVTVDGVTVLDWTSGTSESGSDSVTFVMSLSGYQAFAAGVAESCPQARRPASLGAMIGAFQKARQPYSDARDDFVSAYKVVDTVRDLEKTAIAAVYNENNSGGHARQVVADVARVLGVDIDEGEGHRWDPDHMARVVEVADKIREQRDDLVEKVELWKSLAQRQDNTAPLRMELSTVRRERDHWRARFEGAQANAEYVRAEYTPSDEAEQMKAAIVRQAREISLLRGEAE